MDRRRAAGVLLALAACVAYATAAPTASNHTSLDLYDGAPDGCYYNFQHYGEGDRIMTNEPCLNCTCHNRMLMCYLRVCPFTKPIGQDCTIEKRADQCCPIVTCPDVPVDLLTSTTTSPAEYGATGLGRLDKYGCSIHGKYFPEGSKVPPAPNKPCEHCYCIRNMTTCVMQECTLHVDGCTPIYHKDVCCPVRYSCDHPEDEMPYLDDLSTTVRPTPGFLLTTTTLSPVTQMSQDCLYENQIISDGALIKTEKACDHCYCMKGDIVCVVQECGTPMENEGKNCTALAPREGVCCPDTYICEGDEPTTGTYETDYTTESDKFPTLTPPRRAGSEGSGYRNEPDGIPNIETPTFETETEGSGYEQATVHPTVVTEALPDSHKIEPTDEILSSTVEPHGSDVITTTKESDHIVVTSESDVSGTHQYLPSTTSSYISHQFDESSTTKAQDEDIGSGEEDIATYETDSTSSAPEIEQSAPTVASEENIATTKSSEEEEELQTPSKTPTTTAPITDEDEKINVPKEQSPSIEDNAFDLTTRRDSDEDVDVETSTTFDKEYHITEHDLLRTTSIPTVEETDRKSTESLVQDKITFEPHHYSVSTSAPGFEDEIATTEPQDDATDSFDGTVGDFDIHHQITTSSTPLLEEIEKDTTDQENIPKESTSDEGKPSTTLSDVPTEETIHNESSKPDLIDEIITTNIPTSVPVFEDDAKTTADSHEIKENDFQDSSEPEQFAPTTSAPVFDDETKKTPPSYSLTTSESHEGHKTDVEESSKPHEYASTTIASVFEDATKTILTDSMVTSKSQEIDVDSSSEPQSHAPTTSGPVFDDETKKTTPSADIMVTKGPEGPEIADKESSEPQQYTPTTSASTIEDVTKLSTPSDSMTTSKTLGQETGVEESSETLQHIPTTSGPIFDDELKETTSSDASTYSKVQESLETSSESQQYTSPTSGPMFDDESKETTPSKSQEGQETDVKESEKPDQYDSTTSSPVSEDKTITQTPLEVVTTSQIPEDQETGVEESSQQYIPTTSGTVFDDETKDTTPSASTTSKAQEGLETDVKKTSEPEETAPTTSAPVFEDKIKVTTPSDAPTKTPEEQETDLKESSEPELYAPTTIAPVFEDEFKETTSESVTKIQEGEEADVKESSEPEQYPPTTSAPVFEDEAKETTPSGAVTKIEEGQDADVKESSEPEQYAPTTNIPGLEDKIKEITSPDESKMQEGQVTDISRPYQYDSTTIAPVSEDKIQKTTPSDAITTSKIQDGQESDDEKSSEPQQYDLTTKSSTFDDYTEETATSLKQNEVTTAEPDKGLNTIPSGSVDEETTEISKIEKYTHSDETISTELIEDKQTTPDISASQEDQFTLSTESSIKDNVDKLGSTETHGITEQTTVYAEPERITSVVYEELTTTEGPEKYATTTSSPSYATVPESTTADLVENEIINEPRIPGEGDCLLNGVTYRNESSVPSIHKCQSGCRCSSSIIKCDPIICSPPPEYMDNCQTTYDSLDSCCPTYVCDHKTETMPPQSHSQMSGTEAPVESPVKCNGDECILSEDKKQPVETSDECKSGSCTGQAESSSHSDVPEKPVDSDEGCTGDLCKSPDSTDQLCNEENGCQVSPVKPCDGAECQDLPDIPSQQQQPCVGDNCDIPLKDCSLGKCDTADEVKIDIEKECTEESCRRKEDSELEQQPPKKCSGSECQSTELISNVEMTTVDTPDLLTEKVEKSPESPATETDVEVPIENIITDLPDQRVTESDSITEAIFTKSTTETPEEIRTLPPKILTTEQHEVTKLPFDIVEQETTKLSNELDNTYGTEQQTTLPDKPFSEDTATSISEEVFTNPPKTYGTGPLEATDDQTSKPQEDKKPAEKTEDTTTATYDLEDVTKKLQVSEEATTEANIEVGSTTLKSYDLDSQKATKSPLDATTQIIDIMGAETLKPHITDLDEITITPKEPQIEEITGKPTDEFVTQPGDLDIQETTKPPEGSDEITKHYSEKPSTASEEAQSEITTSMEVDVITESPKPSVIDTGIQEVTQFPSESYSEKTTSSSAAEEITTETSKDKSEEDTEQSPATEPSPILETVEQNKTTSLGADEYDADTESSLYDGISHETTVPQDTEQDVTTSKTKYETITESSKLDESELFSTTKSPPGFDIDKTMIMVSTEPPKQEPPSVTQSTEPVAASDTTKSSEEEHKLSSETYSPEESTTSQPERVYDLTTLSTLISGSKSTDTEKTTIVYEIPTKTLDQSQPTEPVLDSATESIEKATITSHKDVTSIFDHDIIMTELPLDIVTKSETDSEVTPSSDKLSEEGITTVTEIDITSDKTVTELPQVQETKTPYEVKKTTETSTEIDEVTQKPTTISEDNKMQEDVKTEVPILHETEKDVISQETTSKPSDTTIVSYEVDMKTEQPVAIDSHKEQPAETMNETTETTPILEKATKSPMAAETELPVDSEIEPESHTDTPHIHKHEPSKINTSGQDETKTETPLSNELTTVALQDKFTEIIKEPETTESQDISTKPTEYEEETYTKIPAQGSSEAADTGVSHIPEHSDDELTTPGIQVSELTTEPSIVTTESSGPQEKDTEKPAETTQKESLETPVTEQSIVEPTRSTEDRETQTIIPAQESSTEEQVSTEIHRLSTESPKETYTEVFEEDITTAKPVSSDTEKIFEPVTEFVEKVTKDSEIKTPEQEVFEPSQPTTESAEVTKVQEDITVTKDSDSTPVRPSIIETTKIPEATEASLDLEIITGHPGEDIETSSPKHEFSEATTSGKIEDENVPVEKESTEIPVTVSDQQTVEVITEAQPAPTDTATEKQETVTELVEEEIPPSKTERPEILIYQTTSSTFEESAKSTPSPAEEASTESDQTLLTSIESHVTDEDKLATTPVSELDKPSTPKIPEVEVQTEKATTPTESPLEPEPSVVTLAPVEEKQTTAKTEEFSTASPLFTKPPYKPTEAPATEHAKPIPSEDQPTDEEITPDEEPSIPPSGTSGYGTDPDYMEEDQTFGPGTCRYGGKVYVSAQQIPRDDPCDFCFCFRSDIICLQQSCPPPIHGCHEEPISGFCCPRYECPVSMATTVNVTTTTTTTTTTLPPHFPVHSYKGSAQKRGCLIKGHTYKVGEVVRASSGPCLHCTCGGDGQMKCDPKQCTPEPMLRQMIAAAVSAKRRR